MGVPRDCNIVGVAMVVTSYTVTHYAIMFSPSMFTPPPTGFRAMLAYVLLMLMGARSRLSDSWASALPSVPRIS